VHLTARVHHGHHHLGADVQSNQVHLVAVDHQGQLPDMLEELNKLLARSLNQVRGEFGTFFDRNNVDIN
jgi:hypothetical protein